MKLEGLERQYFFQKFCVKKNVINKIPPGDIFVKGNKIKFSKNRFKIDFLITDIPIKKLSKKIQLKFKDNIFKNLKKFKNKEIQNKVFFIFFSTDDKALPILKKIQENNGYYIPHFCDRKTFYRHTDRVCKELFINLNEEFYTSKRNHIGVAENIFEALSLVGEIKGDIVEIGVYEGRSLKVINEAYKLLLKNKRTKKKSIYGFDTFEGFINEKNNSDIIWNNTHKLFNYEKNFKNILKRINDRKVSLVRKDIIKDKISLKRISFAMIDVDSYSATYNALNKVHKVLSKRGIIMLEDPASTPHLYSAYLAMEKFLEKNKKTYLKIFKNYSYWLIKL